MDFFRDNSRVSYDKVPELSLVHYLNGSPQEKEYFVEELFSALKHFGFIIIKDHSISMDLLEKAYTQSKEFFSLSEEIKIEYSQPKNGFQRGYTPFGTEHAKDSHHPDLKEFYHVGRDLEPGHRFSDSYPKNIWPNEVEDFQKTFQKLYQQLDDMGRVLLRAITGPLDLPQDYFDHMTESGSSLLRLLHYPPIPKEADPRCLRAAAHEDINLITLLVSASASGLELQTHNGEWLPIETEANNIIVDSGDMLSRITNEVIPSTTHRVVNPQGPNTSRYSMPFFMHPNPDALLTCLDSCRGKGAQYQDITAEDFLMQRLREIGLSSPKT